MSEKKVLLELRGVKTTNENEQPEGLNGLPSNP